MLGWLRVCWGGVSRPVGVSVFSHLGRWVQVENRLSAVPTCQGFHHTSNRLRRPGSSYVLSLFLSSFSYTLEIYTCTQVDYRIGTSYCIQGTREGRELALPTRSCFAALSRRNRLWAQWTSNTSVPKPKCLRRFRRLPLSPFKWFKYRAIS